MLSRREMLRVTAGAGACVALGACGDAEAEAGLITKPIPSTGEPMPVIGIGTALDHYGMELPPEEVAIRRELFREFVRMGGRILDIFAFGSAEEFCGELIRELGLQDQFFIAAKTDVSDALRAEADTREAGLAHMAQSFENFGTEVIDLMQIVNLSDWENQLPLLREWKEEGRFRYIGGTIFRPEQHELMRSVMEREMLDFVQLNYSLRDRRSENRLLPLAADRGMAVIANVPFGRGAVFRRLGDRELPGWAAEIGCETMAQIALKFVVSHPAVTCSIPGTYKMDYLRDNMGAARGPMPDAAMRQMIADWYDALPPVADG